MLVKLNSVQNKTAAQINHRFFCGRYTETRRKPWRKPEKNQNQRFHCRSTTARKNHSRWVRWIHQIVTLKGRWSLLVLPGCGPRWWTGSMQLAAILGSQYQALSNLGVTGALRKDIWNTGKDDSRWARKVHEVSTTKGRVSCCWSLGSICSNGWGACETWNEHENPLCRASAMGDVWTGLCLESMECSADLVLWLVCKLVRSWISVSLFAFFFYFQAACILVTTWNTFQIRRNLWWYNGDSSFDCFELLFRSETA